MADLPSNQARKNTDRLLWRGTHPAGDYYADSIHVTEDGGIGINVGGYVYVRTLREWHALVHDPAGIPPQENELEGSGHCASCGRTMTTANAIHSDYCTDCNNLEEETAAPFDPHPPRLAVDAKGYVWRVYEPDGVGTFEEMWSMCPVNPDNSPIPYPVTFYYPEGQDGEQ